jgi:hypothetical protein
MKQCFFCLENIHESAEACGCCGNWQPSADEISSAWKAVLGARVGLPIAPFLVFLLFFVILIASSEVASLDVVVGVLVWVVVPFIFARNMYRQRRDIDVFANAVELDHLLQQELKARQLKKSRSLAPMLVTIGILILLAVSNPSTQEFHEFYLRKEKAIVVPNKINLIICSVYVTDTQTYLGVAGNFFQISSDSSSQQNQDENVPNSQDEK